MSRKSENAFVLAALGVAGFLLPARNAPQQGARRAMPARKQDGAEQDGVRRGKPARAPGLWPLIKRVGSEVSENGLMTQAAAITFYALLSIFPALAAMVSIYGLVADPHTIANQVQALSAVLPGGGQEILNQELSRLASASNSGLSWALIVGLLTSLWTARQAMSALFNALNAVHEVEETRGYFKLQAMVLGCTVAVILFLVLAIAGVVVVPAILGALGLGFIGVLMNWLRWPLLLVAVTCLLAVLFRFGPCRTRVVWRWISWGSGFAAVAWVLVSVLFSWYVANFGSYNKTYGSLGAVVGFMTWIWISSTVVLVGAQVDAELEETTRGQQRSRRGSEEKPAVKSA